MKITTKQLRQLVHEIITEQRAVPGLASTPTRGVAGTFPRVLNDPDTSYRQSGTVARVPLEVAPVAQPGGRASSGRGPGRGGNYRQGIQLLLRQIINRNERQSLARYIAGARWRLRRDGTLDPQFLTNFNRIALLAQRKTREIENYPATDVNREVIRRLSPIVNSLKSLTAQAVRFNGDPRQLLMLARKMQEVTNQRRAFSTWLSVIPADRPTVQPMAGTRRPSRGPTIDQEINRTTQTVNRLIKQINDYYQNLLRQGGGDQNMSTEERNQVQRLVLQDARRRVVPVAERSLSNVPLALQQPLLAYDRQQADAAGTWRAIGGRSFGSLLPYYVREIFFRARLDAPSRRG